jgi:hypothetical protein
MSARGAGERAAPPVRHRLGAGDAVHMLAAVPANHRPRPRRRPSGRRAVSAAALAGLAAALVSGCAQFNKALGQQEEVVIFRQNTPNAVRLQVRAACSHIPRVVPEPLPTDGKVSDELYNVRFQVGSASTGDLAHLQRCLSRFHSVVGLETNTPGGD